MLFKKKKRKFKRWFKNILYIFILALVIYFLQIKNIIDLNDYYKKSIIFINSTFKKNKTPNSLSLSKSENIILFFKNNLTMRGMSLATTSIDSNGNIKLFLTETKNSSGYIYLSEYDDPNYLWLNFISAIQADPLKTQLKDDLINLEYIDLRFSNKIFYKFKDYELNISNSASTSLNSLN